MAEALRRSEADKAGSCAEALLRYLNGGVAVLLRWEWMTGRLSSIAEGDVTVGMEQYLRATSKFYNA